MRPTGKIGEWAAKARHTRKAGGTGCRAVGKKPFATTIRANRSSFSAAMRRPTSEPQSWQTSVAFRRSTDRSHSVIQVTCRRYV